MGKFDRKLRHDTIANGDKIDKVKLFGYYGWECQNCGCHTPKEYMGTKEHNAPTIDHKLPISRGGQHTWDNVTLLCRSCNTRKGTKFYG